MRSRMVVPATKRRELCAQVVAVDDRDAIELLLQRPEEPFDPAVLPRTARLDALQANAEPSERGLHRRRDEACFVVDANPPRDAISPNRFDHLTQDRQAAFVGQVREPQRGAAAMVEDAEN